MEVALGAYPKLESQGLKATESFNIGGLLSQEETSFS